MIRLDDVAWLWRQSKHVADNGGAKALKTRLDFLAGALRRRVIVDEIRTAPADSSLARLLSGRPAMLGAFLWPYQNAAWGTEERWRRIIAHCAAIDALGPPFLFDIDQRLVLLDLGAVSPGLAVVLDQPVWFMREGQLTINLFIDDFRAYSLAFSCLREDDGSLIAYVGAMQGRNREDILDLYRVLTKKLFGIRPRDFLIEVFRMLCRSTGVARIFAVADACRHHRHAYFNALDEFTGNYDDIWIDRGGARLDDQTFELGVQSPRRAPDDVRPNKRSMYRKRYEFLDALEERLGSDLPNLKAVRFKDS